jgi:hypothetical protein
MHETGAHATMEEASAVDRESRERTFGSGQELECPLARGAQAAGTRSLSEGSQS